MMNQATLQSLQVWKAERGYECNANGVTFDMANGALDELTQFERDRRWQYITHLIVTYPGQAADVQSYVSEAEHQEGYGYWANFKTLSDVVSDFELYTHEAKDE